MSGESSSRTNLEIPQAQKDLLNALLKTGKPVVLVLFDGRPLVLKEENETVPVILNAWFAGTEAGYAIADVLFGDVNPSGKLSFTFPVKLADNGAHALGEFPGGDEVKYNEGIFVGW